ncbi:MAG: PspC domain-containing protein [Candidatus Yanofskybacteria bacterium]|nr:PspC domain-containing protein [Candidatus Yanofskybacteria bacterium]
MFENLKGKKLRRSPADGILFGVASGMAAYFEVDAVFMRLLWLVLGVVAHVWPALLVYAVAVVLMPIDPAQDTVLSSQEPKDVTPESRMDSSQNM